MPSAFAYPLADDKYNWAYETEPEPGMDGRRMSCPRGRVIGGSSSVNGMVYIRGHALDYDRWAEARGSRALVVRALPSVFQEVRDAPSRSRRLPRRRRPALRHHRRDGEPALSRVHRGRRAGRLRAHRGHERLPAGRPRPDGPDDLQGPPLERRDGVPAAGSRALESHRRIAHARHPRAVREDARDRRRVRCSTAAWSRRARGAR